MGGRESYRLLRSSVSCLSVLGEAVCSILLIAVADVFPSSFVLLMYFLVCWLSIYICTSLQWGPHPSKYVVLLEISLLYL